MFWEIFWEIFGKILGEIFGNSLGYLNIEMNWFVCQDFGFCQDFVSMEKEDEISILKNAIFVIKI